MNTATLRRSGTGVLRSGSDVGGEEVRGRLDGEIGLHPVQDGGNGAVVIEHDEGVERSGGCSGDHVVEGDDRGRANAVRRELLS